jgi:hypothetical protein
LARPEFRDQYACAAFPPPWSVEDVGPEVRHWAFVVKDSTEQQLAYVYFEDELGWRSAAR